MIEPSGRAMLGDQLPRSRELIGEETDRCLRILPNALILCHSFVFGLFLVVRK